MNHYELSLVQHTRLTEKLPSDLETKIMKFQKYVIGQEQLILLHFAI